MKSSILQMPLSPADESRIVALFGEGVVFEENSQLTEAEDCYKRVLQLDPRHCSTLVNLGTICYNRKDYGRAVTLYRQATKIAPDYALAFFNLGNALDETAGTGAITAYETALKIEPLYADAHYNLALALEQQGHPRRAIKHWRTYLKRDAAGPFADHARKMIRKTLANDCLSIVWRAA